MGIYHMSLLQIPFNTYSALNENILYLDMV